MSSITISGDTTRLKAIEEMKKRLKKAKHWRRFHDAVYPYILGVMITLGILFFVMEQYLSLLLLFLTFGLLAFMNQSHIRCLRGWVDDFSYWKNKWVENYFRKKGECDELRAKLNAQSKKARKKKGKR